MQIHELPMTTSANNTDVVAADTGSTTNQITIQNLGKKITTDAVPTFTSWDNTASPSGWMATDYISSGSSLGTLLTRLSMIARNVRWLYSRLGTADISSIGSGTVTGAISKINSNLNDAINTHATIDDCNNATSNGIYNIGSSTLNRPTNYGIMLVMRYSGTYQVQLAVSVNTQTPKLYMRANSSSGWGSWLNVY